MIFKFARILCMILGTLLACWVTGAAVRLIGTTLFHDPILSLILGALTFGFFLLFAKVLK